MKLYYTKKIITISNHENMLLNQDLVSKTYKILVDRATKDTPINYGDLYKMLGLDHRNPTDRHVGSALLEATNEISGKNFMISSFAVSKSGNKPYSGFYVLAEQYGRINHDLSDTEKDKFWTDEMKSVHEKYKKKK